MKPLGDYLHDQGLKLGLSSSAGTTTCSGKTGSLGMESSDAKDYASWGVDYLKYDNCNPDDTPVIQRYTAMSNAINSTGR